MDRVTILLLLLGPTEPSLPVGAFPTFTACATQMIALRAVEPDADLLCREVYYAPETSLRPLARGETGPVDEARG